MRLGLVRLALMSGVITACKLTPDLQPPPTCAPPDGGTHCSCPGMNVGLFGCAETFTCRQDGTWAPYDASCLTGAGVVADAGVADGGPDACQGLVCGKACCDPSQEACGLGLGSRLATTTGEMVCCNTQDNEVCPGSTVGLCCPKQTSQCVNGVCCPNAEACETYVGSVCCDSTQRCVVDTDPDSSFFHSNICVSCLDAGCD